MSILDSLAQTDAVTRVRVLSGEDADPERRADKRRFYQERRFQLS